jgi:hypothetical protein
MLAQLHACLPPIWKNTEPVAPEEVVRQWEPDTVRIRITQAEGEIKLARPTIVADSLVGLVEVDDWHERVAYGLDEARPLQWRGTGLTVQAPSGDTLFLDDAWLTPDSVGGGLHVTPSPARVAYPLRAVARLEVKKLPKAEERERSAGAVVLPGERIKVRFRAADREREVEGGFRQLAGDSVTIRVDDDRDVSIPLDAVTGLQVRVGTKSNVGTGALVGVLLAGLLVGAGALAMAGSEEDPNASGVADSGTLIFLGALALGGAVLVLGVVGGAATRRDRWEDVSLDALRVPGGSSAVDSARTVMP